MSFVESYSQHYSMDQYGDDSQQLSSDRNSSIIRTGSSIPILSTNNTSELISVRRYSSEVNFYSAAAIYLVMKRINTENLLYVLTTKDIMDVVQTVVSVDDNIVEEAIKTEVVYYLNVVFFPEMVIGKSESLELYKLRLQIQFVLRAYGPEAPECV